MSPAYLAPLANHLWQSTLFASAAGLLTLALRNNPARVRYWVWMAASYKFLIPLSVLIALGGQVRWRKAPEISASNIAVMMDVVSRPFAARTLPVALPATQLASTPWPAILLGIWAVGFLGIAFAWWVRWRHLRTTVPAGSPLELAVPIRVVSSPTLLEPGVFGIFRPVLVLPEGILEKLTPAQLEAVIEHELCHVRHRDNLTATIQMFVETIFWFHPLVWWMGKRMVEEREHACDEEVLQRGSQPRDYAEGILRISKHYVESRLVCVSGVTGADLKKRIQTIMDGRMAVRLGHAKKALLAVAATVALAAPIMVGVMAAPAIRAQNSVAPETTARLQFEVASIKPTKPNTGDTTFFQDATIHGRRVIASSTVRDLIEYAFGVRFDRLSGGPVWLGDDQFDVEAKAAGEGPLTIAQSRRMVQSLLEDRFQLQVHRETRVVPVYALTVAKSGSKLRPAAPESERRNYVMGNSKGIHMETTQGTMEKLAQQLSVTAGRSVIDKTGLGGSYAFTLDWFPANRIPPPDSDAPSMFAALQEQLGLKLENTTAPIEFLIIDHVERPSEN